MKDGENTPKRERFTRRATDVLIIRSIEDLKHLGLGASLLRGVFCRLEIYQNKGSLEQGMSEPRRALP